jgi:hypothetical protein
MMDKIYYILCLCM